MHRSLRGALISVCAATLIVTALGAPARAKVSGPNGLIAFVRSDQNLGDAAYLMNPDGTHLRPVLPGVQASVPHWSPDGRLLALQTGLNDCPPSVQTTILNPDTGQTRVLPPPNPNMATGCSVWSPDATHFACDGENESGSANGLYTIRSSDGGGLTRITNAGGAADIPIDYSPNGRQILFGRVDAGDHHCTKTSALFVVNVDGTGLRQITPGGFCDDDGSWSPDGTRIAFEHRGKVFVVHPDGTGLAQIPLKTGSRRFAGDISWSPDGTQLTFILFTPTGAPAGGPHATFQGGIATANADGSNVHQLTISSMFDHEADWGPHPITG
jgi:Tol biopolymer transport system component